MVSVTTFNFVAVSFVLSLIGALATPLPIQSSTATKTHHHHHHHHPTPLSTANNKTEPVVAEGHTLAERNNKYLDAAWAGAKAAGKSLIEERALEEQRGIMTDAAFKVGKAAFQGGKAAYHSLHDARALSGDVDLNSIIARRDLDLDVQHLISRGGFCNAVHAGIQAAGKSLVNARDLQELERSPEARRGLCDVVVAGAKAAGKSLLNAREVEELQDLYARHFWGEPRDLDLD